MMLTEEMIAEDEKRWNDRNIVAELGYCGKNIRHRKNITNDDIRFYAYIMRKAHAMLKEQEEIVRCGDCENFCFDNISPNAGQCMLTHMSHSKTWFCAHGKSEEGR